MFCVYVIRSLDRKYRYIGYTNNLKRRMAEHNKNKGHYTKNKGPFELIYFECYKSEEDAKAREGNLKRFAQAYTQLRRRIKNSLE